MSDANAPLFGIAAEFDTEAQILTAAAAARARNLGRVDAFTPAPVPGLDAILDVGRRGLSFAAIAGTALGLFGFFGMCVEATMIDYPFLIGGRPAFSWPYYVIPSISVGMLLGALAVTFAMLFLARLPRLNHPAFNIENFARASRDRYFLVIEAVDETFDTALVTAFLRSLSPHPASVHEVPR
jgi:hypothetical protein